MYLCASICHIPAHCPNRRIGVTAHHGYDDASLDKFPNKLSTFVTDFISDGDRKSDFTVDRTQNGSFALV
jgi:hypothetical protein